MNNVIQLSLLQMISAYLFIVVLLFIVKAKNISREREILIASIRMTLQLMIAGVILVYLMKNPSPWLTLLVLLGMELFSIFNILKRIKDPMSNALKKVVALSMMAGSLVCLFYFLWIVIQIDPWYDPQYFIPIAGMLIGNSMTGVHLGVQRLIGGMREKRNNVEGALMLGATVKTAAKEVVDEAFDAAILPTINSMLGIGIVFLPGMMTGQILSGISPLTAIQYQIAIMLGIAGSVSLTVILVVQLGYRTFFNDQDQLIR